jgi:adenylosuccinate synthase
VHGARTDEMPMTQTEFHHARPIYEEMPGWHEDISAATSFAELPAPAQDYVRAVEELAGAPVSAVGVGPGRDQTLVLRDLV